MPLELPEVQTEAVISPNRETQQRVQSIDTSVQSLKDHPIVRFFVQLFKSFGQQNRSVAPRQNAPSTSGRTREDWTGGMTQDQYLAALGRADSADTATLASMMTDQPTLIRSMREATSKRASGITMNSLVDNMAGNVQAIATGNDRTAADPFKGVVDGILADTEPEALRGYLFLREVVKRAGGTLTPGTKFDDLASMNVLQRAYETATGLNGSQRPTYAVWLTGLVGEVRAEGGTLTAKAIAEHAMRKVGGTAMAGVVRSLLRPRT